MQTNTYVIQDVFIGAEWIGRLKTVAWNLILMNGLLNIDQHPHLHLPI